MTETETSNSVAISKALVLMNIRAEEVGVQHAQQRVMMGMRIVGKRSVRSNISEAYKGNGNVIDTNLLRKLHRRGLIDQKEVDSKYHKTRTIYGYALTEFGRAVLDYILEGGKKP
jgi:hypothetical protein